MSQLLSRVLLLFTFFPSAPNLVQKGITSSWFASVNFLKRKIPFNGEEQISSWKGRKQTAVHPKKFDLRDWILSNKGEMKSDCDCFQRSSHYSNVPNWINHSRWLHIQELSIAKERVPAVKSGRSKFNELFERMSVNERPWTSAPEKGSQSNSHPSRSIVKHNAKCKTIKGSTAVPGKSSSMSWIVSALDGNESAILMLPTKNQRFNCHHPSFSQPRITSILWHFKHFACSYLTRPRTVSRQQTFPVLPHSMQTEVEMKGIHNNGRNSLQRIFFFIWVFSLYL